LAANASRLATISDNIANSATYGYRRVQADFHSMVIASTGGTYSAGGVRTTTQRLIDQGGALTSTANPTDLAVRGRGFLPVSRVSEVSVQNGGSTMLLATTGSFRTNSEGFLTTESGLVLMGWPARADGTMPSYPRDTSDGLEPIKINTNQFTGEPTTRMSIGVNLPATSTGFESNGELQDLSIEYFDNLGTSQNLSLEFSPIGAPPTGTKPASKISSDFETFLKMLTAQISNQDPLNPIDASDYSTQLATFSGVEQQVLTNDLLHAIQSSLSKSGLVEVSHWIGKQVEIANKVTFDGHPPEIRADLSPDATHGVVEIRTSGGGLVASLPFLKGSTHVSWDGRTQDGNAVPFGQYTA